MVNKFKLLRTGVGFIYPVYRSVLAVLSEEVEDDLTWLRYWVVLALVSIVELMVDPLVDFFPGYLLAKCAFLIWCMAPLENNGVSFIFTQVILQTSSKWKKLRRSAYTKLLFQIIFPLFKKRYLKIEDNQIEPAQEKVNWVNFWRRNQR